MKHFVDSESFVRLVSCTFLASRDEKKKKTKKKIHKPTLLTAPLLFDYPQCLDVRSSQVKPFLGCLRLIENTVDVLTKQLHSTVQHSNVIALHYTC